MTVEEAVVAVLAIAAGVLLFVGLAQALDHATPARRGSRPRTARPVPGEAEALAPAAEPAPMSPRTEPPELDRTRELPLFAGTPREEPALLGPPFVGPADERPEGDPAPAIPWAAERVARESPASLVERCAGLYLGGKYAEMLRLIEPEPGGEALGATAGVVLGTLAGLAHQELGDPGAATRALGGAVAAMPGAPTEGCPPRLAALAMIVARRLLNPPESQASTRTAQARLANFWLRWRLVAVPGDPDALALLDGASAARAGAAEDRVAARLRERDWGGARQVIERARADGDVHGARAEALERMLLSSVKREVERLVGPAIRGTRDEGRAVQALERADQLLDGIPAAALTPAQRGALGRRTAWAHARIGIRRVRAGRLDAGIDALAEALARKGLGPARQRRVRETLVEALEGLATEAARTLAEVGGDPDARAGVAGRVAQLTAQVAAARGAGVPGRLLDGVADRARRLKAEADGEPAA